ncbi:MAG TPA: hypothetical protein VGE18_02035 [Candidatus Paceibacterota bacterium]
MARKIPWSEIAAYIIATGVVWYTFSPLSALFFAITLMLWNNILFALLCSYLLWALIGGIIFFGYKKIYPYLKAL